MSIKYFTDNDMDELFIYRVPKNLLIGNTYKDMNMNAKAVYILLLDRMQLARENGWRDDQGRFYVRMTTAEGAEMLNITAPTFTRMKKELAEFGLIEEMQGVANQMYVNKLYYTDEDMRRIRELG